jgi:RNA polymerase sigma-70 factor (ECF subfamily)
MSDTLSDQELRELLPRLRRFALWLTREPSAADDLVQNCLERALTRWSSRDPAASLKSWLFTILYRQFIDSRRRAGRFQKLMEVFSGGGEEEAAEPSAEDAVIASTSLEAFSRLSPDHRAILLMVTVEGFSYQETADALQVPIGTVMSRLSRARLAYRALTEGETPTPALRRIK